MSRAQKDLLFSKGIYSFRAPRIATRDHNPFSLSDALCAAEKVTRWRCKSCRRRLSVYFPQRRTAEDTIPLQTHRFAAADVLRITSFVLLYLIGVSFLLFASEVGQVHQHTAPRPRRAQTKATAAEQSPSSNYCCDFTHQIEISLAQLFIASISIAAE